MAAGQEVGARQRSRPNRQFARKVEAEETLVKMNPEGKLKVGDCVRECDRV